MKILAIRGENIASLAQPFAVEFEQSPLKNQGLIAITGKTGAGKSSLLDTMCLALFEQVPRFSGRERSVEVGSESEAQKLKANDVRHLISRGKSGGLAEVDFVGVDGKSYRVRWSARRARNQVTGRWQQSTRELVDLSSNQVSSATKREFQEQVDALVGLDYEQFRRAVVLPQGEFSAFLKAPEEQRSALLERMTGTELYSQISQQVYENAKGKLQACQDLERQLGGTELLDEQQRAELEEQQSALQAQMQKLELALSQQQTYNRGLQQLDGLQNALNQNSVEQQQLQQQQADNLALEQKLDRLQQLAPLRGNAEQRNERQQALERYQQRQVELAEQQQQLSAQAQQLQAQQSEQAKALESWQQQQQQQEPLIEQALSLEASIRERHKQLSELQQQHQKGLHGLQQLQVRSEQHQQAISQLEQRQQQIQSWQAQHQGLAVLAQQPGQLEQLIISAVEQLEQRDQLHSKRQLSEQAQRQRQGELNHVQRAEVDVAQKLAELKPQLQAVDEQELEQLQLHYQSVEQQRQQLNDSLSVKQQWAQCLEQRQQCSEQQQGLAQAEQQAQQQLSVCHDALEQLNTQLKEAELAYSNARSVLDLSHYRRELADGEACPLCGSEHHPYATQQPAVQDILQQLTQRGEQLRREQHRKLAEFGELQQSQQYLAQQAQQLAQQQQQLGAVIAQLQQWAQAQPLALAEDAEQALSDYQQQAEQLQQLSNEQQQRYQQIVQFQQRQQQQHHLQHQLSQLEAMQADIEQGKQLAKQAMEQLSQQLDELDSRLQQSDKQLAQQSEQLDSALAPHSWQQWLAQGGVGHCIEQARYLESEYRSAQQHLDAAAEQLEQQRLAQQKVQVELESEQQHAQQRCEQLEQLEQSYQQDTAERGKLLDGLPVAQWKQAQQQRGQQLAEQKQQLDNQALHLAKQQTSVESELQHVQAESEQAQQQLAQLQDDFAKHCAEMAVEVDEAQALLSHSPQQLQAWQQQVQQFQQRVTELASQQATLSEQHRQGLAQVEQQLAELEAQAKAFGLTHSGQFGEHKQALEEQIYQLRSQLERDQLAQQQASELSAKLQAARDEHEVWGQLNELIGSASGAKFRTFAQQLTLENLLAEANSQLKQIAPRYLLQRVPESQLALQVIDRDMGDEVRSISSLSGGETFLVSLALALALSGLSASNLKIQSLFIDEGFGSLDPESLDVALACLDSLQASGRQVTLISHVQALVERIAAKIRLRPQGAGRSELEVELS
ncbi:AAA family ATPase [Aliagarivorans marinus]|uniref:AAA family ATPase n=1 Tax=Aliagarivorans marinus TaxID=561965 RepID=UPI00041A9DC5|nr:AAA family ATPase [Aliagarivorans marinus]